ASSPLNDFIGGVGDGLRAIREQLQQQRDAAAGDPAGEAGNPAAPRGALDHMPEGSAEPLDLPERAPAPIAPVALDTADTSSAERFASVMGSINNETELTLDLPIDLWIPARSDMERGEDFVLTFDASCAPSWPRVDQVFLP